MIKKLLTVCCLLSLMTLCAAQEGKTKSEGKAKPDFNGTWLIDKSKSDYGRAEGTPIANADITMTVALSEPEFHVTRKMTLNGNEHVGELVFYTDGRGETNHALLGGGDLKTKTKWSGSKLVSKASISRRVREENFNIDIEEKWELSSDGKTLTDSFSMSGPNGTRAVKLVYTRAPQ
ncbi:MAG TPA: hypothetical protein VGC91_02525 [Pyrinomonadaceae bacterium]|jgi:hypothetical protein